MLADRIFYIRTGKSLNIKKRSGTRSNPPYSLFVEVSILIIPYTLHTILTCSSHPGDVRKREVAIELSEKLLLLSSFLLIHTLRVYYFISRELFWNSVISMSIGYCRYCIMVTHTLDKHTIREALYMFASYSYSKLSSCISP